MVHARVYNWMLVALNACWPFGGIYHFLPNLYWKDEYFYFVCFCQVYLFLFNPIYLRSGTMDTVVHYNFLSLSSQSVLHFKGVYNASCIK